MRFRRTVSFATAIVFLIQTIGYSAPGLPDLSFFPAKLSPEIPKIEIPFDLGKIEKSFLSPESKGLLVHIQTAHGSYEAQKNIQAILEQLVSRYGFKMLFLEGASGPLQSEFFGLFKNPALNLKVADVLMKHGEFTGAEMFLLSEAARQKKSVPAFGIEDEAIYQKDLALFREIVRAKDSSGGFLAQLEETLGLLESRAFSKGLREFVKDWRRFREERCELSEFIRILAKTGREALDLDLSDASSQLSYGSILRLARLRELEKEIDRAKAEEEKAELIAFLKGKIDPALLSELSRFEMLPGGTGNAYPRFLFERIFESARASGLDFRKYPNFSLYAEYAIFQSEIESEKLFGEIDRLTEAVFSKLAATEEEQVLIGAMKDMILLSKLLGLELSRSEYGRMLTRIESCSPAALAARMEKLLPEGSGFTADGAIEELFAKALEFYRLAVERENHFMENAGARMTKEAGGRSIIVTGGFHTDGLAERMKAGKFSYICISPRIREIGKSQEIYLRAMLGETKIEDSQIEVPLRLGAGRSQTAGDDSPLRKATELVLRNAGVSEAAEIAAQIAGGARALTVELPASAGVQSEGETAKPAGAEAVTRSEPLREGMLKLVSNRLRKAANLAVETSLNLLKEFLEFILRLIQLPAALKDQITGGGTGAIAGNGFAGGRIIWETPLTDAGAFTAGATAMNAGLCPAYAHSLGQAASQTRFDRWTAKLGALNEGSRNLPQALKSLRVGRLSRAMARQLMKDAGFRRGIYFESAKGKQLRIPVLGSAIGFTLDKTDQFLLMLDSVAKSLHLEAGMTLIVSLLFFGSFVIMKMAPVMEAVVKHPGSAETGRALIIGTVLLGFVAIPAAFYMFGSVYYGMKGKKMPPLTLQNLQGMIGAHRENADVEKALVEFFSARSNDDARVFLFPRFSGYQKALSLLIGGNTEFTVTRINNETARLQGVYDRNKKPSGVPEAAEKKGPGRDRGTDLWMNPAASLGFLENLIEGLEKGADLLEQAANPQLSYQKGRRLTVIGLLFIFGLAALWGTGCGGGTQVSPPVVLEDKYDYLAHVDQQGNVNLPQTIVEDPEKGRVYRFDYNFSAPEYGFKWFRVWNDGSGVNPRGLGATEVALDLKQEVTSGSPRVSLEVKQQTSAGLVKILDMAVDGIGPEWKTLNIPLPPDTPLIHEIVILVKKKSQGTLYLGGIRLVGPKASSLGAAVETDASSVPELSGTLEPIEQSGGSSLGMLGLLISGLEKGADFLERVGDTRMEFGTGRRIVLNGMVFLMAGLTFLGCSFPSGAQQIGVIGQKEATSQTDLGGRYDGVFSEQTLISDAQTQKKFVQQTLQNERGFYQPGISYNGKSGLTYDGQPLNPQSLLPYGEARHWSAPSKESLHLSLLALSVKGNSEAQIVIPRAVALDVLKKKIESYKKFAEAYQGFGGFLPWFEVSDDGLVPAGNWPDRVPALDNGQWAWSMYLAYHALEDAGEKELAREYKTYFNGLRSSARQIFYAGEGRIRGESRIADIHAKPKFGNYSSPQGTFPLRDSYEGELMTYFMCLFGGLSDEEVGKVWDAKRGDLQPVEFETAAGPITVARGYYFSAHEAWKYMILPYTDVEPAKQIFINGELARTLYSEQNGIPGLMAAAHIPNPENPASPNYAADFGVPELAGYPVRPADVITPYGSFPVILAARAQGNPGPGLAWLDQMLDLPKMQGPLGMSESFKITSVDGGKVKGVAVPLVTWDVKGTTALALAGGTTHEIAAALTADGLYDRFRSRVEAEYGRAFPVIHTAEVPFGQFNPARTAEEAQKAEKEMQKQEFVSVLAATGKVPVQPELGPKGAPVFFESLRALYGRDEGEARFPQGTLKHSVGADGILRAEAGLHDWCGAPVGTKIPGKAGGYNYVYLRVRAPQGKAEFKVEMHGFFSGKKAVSVSGKEWQWVEFKLSDPAILSYLAFSDVAAPVEIADLWVSKGHFPGAQVKVSSARGEEGMSLGEQRIRLEKDVFCPIELPGFSTPLQIKFEKTAFDSRGRSWKNEGKFVFDAPGILINMINVWERKRKEMQEENGAWIDGAVRQAKQRLRGSGRMPLELRENRILVFFDPETRLEYMMKVESLSPDGESAEIMLKPLVLEEAASVPNLFGSQKPSSDTTFGEQAPHFALEQPIEESGGSSLGLLDTLIEGLEKGADLLEQAANPQLSYQKGRRLTVIGLLFIFGLAALWGTGCGGGGTQVSPPVVLEDKYDYLAHVDQQGNVNLPQTIVEDPEKGRVYRFDYNFSAPEYGFKWFRVWNDGSGVNPRGLGATEVALDLKQEVTSGSPRVSLEVKQQTSAGLVKILDMAVDGIGPEWKTLNIPLPPDTPLIHEIVILVKKQSQGTLYLGGIRLVGPKAASLGEMPAEAKASSVPNLFGSQKPSSDTTFGEQAPHFALEQPIDKNGAASVPDLSGTLAPNDESVGASVPDLSGTLAPNDESVGASLGMLDRIIEGLEKGADLLEQAANPKLSYRAGRRMTVKGLLLAFGLAALLGTTGCGGGGGSAPQVLVEKYNFMANSQQDGGSDLTQTMVTDPEKGTVYRFDFNLEATGAAEYGYKWFRVWNGGSGVDPRPLGVTHVAVDLKGDPVSSSQHFEIEVKQQTSSGLLMLADDTVTGVGPAWKTFYVALPIGTPRLHEVVVRVNRPGKGTFYLGGIRLVGPEAAASLGTSSSIHLEKGVRQSLSFPGLSRDVKITLNGFKGPKKRRMTRASFSIYAPGILVNRKAIWQDRQYGLRDANGGWDDAKLREFPTAGKLNLDIGMTEEFVLFDIDTHAEVLLQVVNADPFDRTAVISVLRTMVPIRKEASSLGQGIRKILIIDDDASLSRMLKQFIHHTLGEQVVVILDRNGKAGVDTFRRLGDVDVVITDVNMPLMDGFQVVQEINPEGGEPGVPILVITGRDDNLKALESLKTQGRIVAAISKPFSFVPDMLPHLVAIDERLKAAASLGQKIRKVLIVDDNPSDGELADYFVGSWDPSVARVYVSDGARALEAFRAAGDFDLVITDTNMPVKDGIALARELNPPDRERTVPIIMATGEMEKNRAEQEALLNAGQIRAIFDKSMGFGASRKRIAELLNELDNESLEAQSLGFEQAVAYAEEMLGGELWRKEKLPEGFFDAEAALEAGPIFVPRAVVQNEARMGLTPIGVKFLRLAGVKNEIYVEAGSGVNRYSGEVYFSDDEYREAGATVLTHGEMMAKAVEIDVAGGKKVVVSIKEPQSFEKEPEKSELHLLLNALLFTYVHLADPHGEKLTKALQDLNTDTVAYETVMYPEKSMWKTPILAPASEGAGYVTAVRYANFVKHVKGREIVDGRIVLDEATEALIRDNVQSYPGISEDLQGSLDGKKGMVLGGGVAGANAALAMAKMGAEKIYVTEVNDDRIEELTEWFTREGVMERIEILKRPNPKEAEILPREIIDIMKTCNVVVGSILVPGATAPQEVTEAIRRELIEAGNLEFFGDIAIDQGGNIEGSVARKYHDGWVVDEHGIGWFTVTNMPSALPKQISIGLERAKLVYLMALLMGVEKAVEVFPELKPGFNLLNKKVTYRDVAKAHKMTYTPFDYAKAPRFAEIRLIREEAFAAAKKRAYAYGLWGENDGLPDVPDMTALAKAHAEYCRGRVTSVKEARLEIVTILAEALRAAKEKAFELGIKDEVLQTIRPETGREVVKDVDGEWRMEMDALLKPLIEIERLAAEYFGAQATGSSLGVAGGEVLAAAVEGAKAVALKMGVTPKKTEECADVESVLRLMKTFAGTKIRTFEKFRTAMLMILGGAAGEAKKKALEAGVEEAVVDRIFRASTSGAIRKADQEWRVDYEELLEPLRLVAVTVDLKQRQGALTPGDKVRAAALREAGIVAGGFRLDPNLIRKKLDIEDLIRSYVKFAKNGGTPNFSSFVIALGRIAEAAIQTAKAEALTYGVRAEDIEAVIAGNGRALAWQEDGVWKVDVRKLVLPAERIVELVDALDAATAPKPEGASVPDLSGTLAAKKSGAASVPDLSGTLEPKKNGGSSLGREILKDAVEIRAIAGADLAAELAAIEASTNVPNLAQRIPHALPEAVRAAFREIMAGDFKAKVLDDLRSKLEEGKVVNTVIRDEAYRSYFDEKADLDSLAWVNGDGRIIVLNKFYEYLADLRLKDAELATKLFSALLIRLSVIDTLRREFQNHSILVTSQIGEAIQKIAILYETRLAGETRIAGEETVISLGDFSRGFIRLNRFDRRFTAQRSERFMRSAPSRTEKVLASFEDRLRTLMRQYAENRDYATRRGSETLQMARIRKDLAEKFSRLRWQFTVENFNKLSDRTVQGIERIRDSAVLARKVARYTQKYQQILQRLAQYAGDETKTKRLERLNQEARDVLCRLILMEMSPVRIDAILNSPEVTLGSQGFETLKGRMKMLQYHLESLEREFLWLRVRTAGRKEVVQYIAEHGENGDGIGDYLLSDEFFQGDEARRAEYPAFLESAVGEVRGGGKRIRDTVQRLLGGGAIEYERTGYRERALYYKATLDALLRPFWDVDGFRDLLVSRIREEGVAVKKAVRAITVEEVIELMTIGKIYEEQMVLPVLQDAEIYLLENAQDAEAREAIEALFDENLRPDVLQTGADLVTSRYNHIFDLLRAFNHTLSGYADDNLTAYDMIGYLDDTLNRLAALKRGALKGLPGLEDLPLAAKRAMRRDLACVLEWASRGIKPSRTVVIDEIYAALTAMDARNAEDFERAVRWARFHLENYIDENTRISKFTALKAMHIRDRLRQPIEILLSSARIFDTAKAIIAVKNQFFPARFKAPGYSRARARMRGILKNLKGLDGRTVRLAADTIENNRLRERFAKAIVGLEMLIYDIIYKHLTNEEFKEIEPGLKSEVELKVFGKPMDQVTFTREALAQIRDRVASSLGKQDDDAAEARRLLVEQLQRAELAGDTEAIAELNRRLLTGDYGDPEDALLAKYWEGELTGDPALTVEAGKGLLRRLLQTSRESGAKSLGMEDAIEYARRRFGGPLWREERLEEGWFDPEIAKQAGPIFAPRAMVENEARMGLTPYGVKFLRLAGVENPVYVEAGSGINRYTGEVYFSDEDYRRAGAIVLSHEDFWDRAQEQDKFVGAQKVVVSIKEPQEEELKLLKNALLFTYVHLAEPHAKALTEALQKLTNSVVAYETVMHKEKSMWKTPILAPASVGAGWLTATRFANYVKYVRGHRIIDGRAQVDAGTDDVMRENARSFPEISANLQGSLEDKKAMVLGGGVAGANAALAMAKMGAEKVYITEMNDDRIEELTQWFTEEGVMDRIEILKRPDPREAKELPRWIINKMKECHAVVGAILVPGATAPKEVTEKIYRELVRAGNLEFIGDIAIDQGGNVEGSKASKYEKGWTATVEASVFGIPVKNESLIRRLEKLQNVLNLLFGREFFRWVRKIQWFTVTNMPSALPKQISLGLERSKLVYLLALLMGPKRAVEIFPELEPGFNILDGKITYQKVAEAHGMEYAPFAEVAASSLGGGERVKGALRKMFGREDRLSDAEKTLEEGNMSITLPKLDQAQMYFSNDMGWEQDWLELVAPEAPHGSGYIVVAGIDRALDELRGRKFGKDEVEALRQTGRFTKEFLKFLEGFEFKGDIRGLREGEVVAPGTPILQIRASAMEKVLIEDLLMNRIGFACVVATKTSRIVQAANGDFIDDATAARIKEEFGTDVKRERIVADNGFRRAQGKAAMAAARASIIGGAKTTTYVKAGEVEDLEISGTMAHLFVTSWPPEEEIEAFRAYARAHPKNSIFLIDTYDTIEGAKKAITVAKEMEARGEKLFGVRLDSGDLVALSREVREMLDEAGLGDVKIVLSDDLDEEKITDLLSRGAAVDAFGVGTALITGGKQAYLDLEMRASYGRRLWRVTDPEDGSIAGIVQSAEAILTYEKDGKTWLNPPTEELLVPYWENGRNVRKREKPYDYQARMKKNLQALKPENNRLEDSQNIPYQVRVGDLLINPETDLLLVVDTAPTFMPGGGLAVTDGDQVVSPIRRLMSLFRKDKRIATLDKHPHGQITLASSYTGLPPFTILTLEMITDWTEEKNGRERAPGEEGNAGIGPDAKFNLEQLRSWIKESNDFGIALTLWPDHGLADTEESNLHPDLLPEDFDLVFLKGGDPLRDSNGSFFDNGGRPTGLADELRKRGIKRVFVVGLAYDYCVGWTGEGAKAEDFETIMVRDASRPVAFPDDMVEKIERSFAEKGIRLVPYTEDIMEVNRGREVEPSAVPAPTLAEVTDEAPVPDASSALEEDTYHLTMAQALFDENRLNEKATFDYFYRTPPFKEADYVIVAGLKFFLDELRQFRFTERNIEYLRSKKRFSEEFLQFLAGYEFRGDVRSMAEGSIAFPNEPIMQVSGTMFDSLIVEAFILNKMNFSSLIATKAHLEARKTGEAIIENGMAYAQGLSNLEASWGAHIGGASTTTNTDAYAKFGIPLSGWGDQGIQLGAELVTGGVKPALGGVYKLSSFENEPRIKISETDIKTSWPGNKEVWEVTDAEGNAVRHVVAVEGEKIKLGSGEKARPVLIPVVQNGEFVYESPEIEAIVAFKNDQALSYADRPGAPKATTYSDRLQEIRTALIRRTEAQVKTSPEENVRVAMAQVDVTIGDFDGVVAKAKSRIDEAVAQGADLLVFQETLLTGYPAQDLWLDPEFIRKQNEALREIVRYTEEKDLTVVVGAVRTEKELFEEMEFIYNSAFVIRDGAILKHVDKHLLARSEVYSDPREVTPGLSPLDAMEVQPGGNLFTVKGVTFGLCICEDMWQDQTDIVRMLKEQGATDIINISGSHFYGGAVQVLTPEDASFDPETDFEALGVRFRFEGSKLAVREELLARRATANGVNMYYANGVGGQDEIVMDGKNYVYNSRGERVATGRQFHEDMIFVDRTKDGGVVSQEDEAVRGKLELEPVDQVYEGLVLALADYLKKSGMQKVVIGLSGGVDSSIVAVIARDAMSRLGLPATNVIGVSMPNKYSSRGSKTDARQLAENLGITYESVSIRAVFTLFLGKLLALAERLLALAVGQQGFSEKAKGLAEENIQPRLRAIILLFISNIFGNALVLSTGNDTEMRRGYSTVGGDLEGGYSPLGNINKLLVYALGINRNRQVERGLKTGKIPETVFGKAPSAELKPGQTDVAALGFPYHLMVGFDQVYQRVRGDIDKVIEQRSVIDPMGELTDERFAKLIYESMRLYSQQEFKRRQSAPFTVMTPRAHTFGWRRPIATKLYVTYDEILERLQKSGEASSLGKLETPETSSVALAEFEKVFPEAPSVGKMIEVPAEFESVLPSAAVLDYLTAQKRAPWWAVGKVAQTHEEGGLTGGVLYLPEAREDVVRWFMEQFGAAAVLDRTVSEDVRAFNNGELTSLIMKNITVDESLNGFPLIVSFDGLFGGNRKASAEETQALARKLAERMAPKDLLIAVWSSEKNGRKKPNLIANLRALASQFGFRMRDVAEELFPSQIGRMVKAYDTPVISITNVGENLDMEVNLKGGVRVKLDVPDLLANGIDLIQAIGLVRQLADENAETLAGNFLKAGFEKPAEDSGYWQVNSRNLIALIQTAYQAMRSVDTAA